MDEQPPASEASNSDRSTTPSLPATTPLRSPLDAAIEQLLKERPSQNDDTYSSENREQGELLRTLHPFTECDSGDTLIVVNFPKGHASCAWEDWTSMRFIVHSQKLLATGSRVFANLLSPQEQARFFRRMEYTGESFSQRYVIDLTPSAEGDDLAAQLIELSLPLSVRDWWTSNERLGISQYLVSGHDDYCPRHTEMYTDCMKVDNFVKADVTLPGQTEQLPVLDLADIQIPECRAIDDYCPIRHRANIIRLILATQGHDIVLNSAPRVYTLTGIANIFDCTSVVRDSVCTWFIAEPNTAFIDINAEVAFKIAWTLQLANVTRAAFRILVTEKALDTLAVIPPPPGSKLTIFGRPRVDLPDDLQTVVQYAAHKFADRINQTLAQMRSDEFYDLLEIPDYRNLLEVGDLIRNCIAMSQSANQLTLSRCPSRGTILLNELLALHTTLHTKLLEYKNRMISDAMNTPPQVDQERNFDRDRRCYVPRTNWNPTANIYGGFSDAQRLLMPHFWETFSGYPNKITSPCHPTKFLTEDVVRYNSKIEESLMYLRLGNRNDILPGDLYFELYKFRENLAKALDREWIAWTKPDLEAPLVRTNHIVLALNDDEFQYLPLWAGGLDDGTGGVFEAVVPDADMGPIGPGPAYHTGDTVATDASSMSQSARTPSEGSTATLTAGRSLAAVFSHGGPTTTTRDGSSVGGSAVFVTAGSTVASTATLDEDEDFEFDDSDEFSEEAWSQVEEPI
ncbi:hypothetical protein F5Y04DRAFT_105434 [Hypomontagnella monticulosa]|nr:hypothetical protein F5Y04DRAFT_105434 [Hypomontagnella monticulosa]